ncbi:hypothetical protein QA601_18665 [Chitinispirillales bacterium ANBcel5]|uniref:hypothetical protein n=1 Tax=Cellulosispirillum alkaliphilum TaxID=3039283 RepID=UPI002A524948|nr:hypothetical protein [Chitinispirillales bacterium ANBcel5]
MYEKYLTAASQSIITNDLYLAAFLHSVGCSLDHLEHNGRRRVSFVFIGDRCRELRQAYLTGPVKLDMRSFRESLSLIRRLTCAEQQRRSVDGENSAFAQAMADKEQRSAARARIQNRKALQTCSG